MALFGYYVNFHLVNVDKSVHPKVVKYNTKEFLATTVFISKKYIKWYFLVFLSIMCQFASLNRLVSYPAEWVSGPCTKLCATLSVVLEGNYTPTVAQ